MPAKPLGSQLVSARRRAENAGHGDGPPPLYTRKVLLILILILIILILISIIVIIIYIYIYIYKQYINEGSVWIPLGVPRF